jgi:membrane fusion protein, multidrug efflux system
MPVIGHEEPSRTDPRRGRGDKAPAPPGSLGDPDTLPRVESGSAPATPRRRRRVLRYILVIGGALLLLAVLGVLKFSQISMLIGAGKEMQKAGPPPETVSTRGAEQQTWERTLNAVASVVSAKGVTLANEVPGVVLALHFDSGQIVKQGQSLLELDSRVERAQLASVNARLELAQTQLSRSQALVERGVVAQATMDSDQATFKSLTAEKAGLEAQIQKKAIRAPFGGKLGLRQVNLGQYLSPGTTIAVLESPGADFVDFTLPQEHLAVVVNGMKVRASEQGVTRVPVEGEISAVDPTVDPATRSIRVRAKFPERQIPLRPGMFLRVALVLPEKRQVVSIPGTAVVHASYGDSVFVVAEQPGPDRKPRKVARQKFVKLGESRGDFVAVLEGVKAGEEVVTAGAFKLRNGLPVRVDNQSVKVDPKLSPTPENR